LVSSNPIFTTITPKKFERAVRVNALFPHLLGEAAAKTKAKVVQIATDVFTREKGRYVESDTQ